MSGYIDAVRYELLWNPDSDSLSKNVTLRLTQGWSLHGDPFIGQLQNGTVMFYQAVTKSEQMLLSMFKIDVAAYDISEKEFLERNKLTAVPKRSGTP